MTDSPDLRDPLEAAATAFMEDLRLGKSPSVEEYAARFPQVADQILDVFPTILAIESSKHENRQSDGRVSMAGAQLERLNDYRIIGEIGRGGMGIVYEAFQDSLKRRVAIKVLPKTMLLNERHLQRFHREARTAANLHHTHIVPILDIGQQDGFHYYVMQFIDGVGIDEVITHLASQSETNGSRELLASQIAGSLCDGWHHLQSESAPIKELSGTVAVAENKRSRPLNEAATVALSSTDTTPIEDAEPVHIAQPAPSDLSGSYWQSVAEIGVRVASALDYAHQQGTLHRDVKPANILLDRYGNTWIADFGLAKAMEHDDVSRTGDIVGTLRYMAPEQVRGEASPGSDVYGLGLTLYELCTLTSAFSETERKAFLAGQSPLKSPLPLRKINASVPRDLETIVAKATAFDEKQRYHSAGDLADDLRRFVEDRPIRARRTSVTDRAWRWCKRNPALATISSVAAVLLVLLCVVTTKAYVDTSSLLKEESTQRQKAEVTLSIALDALDRVFLNYAPDRYAESLPLALTDDENGESLYEIPPQPIDSRESAKMLNELLVFYDQLAEQGSDTLELRMASAKARRRMGDIHARLGETKAAVAAYERAMRAYQALGGEGIDDAAVEQARIQNAIGNLAGAHQRPSDAISHHKTALAILDKIPANDSVNFELARTRYFLGRSRRSTEIPRGRGPRPGLDGEGPGFGPGRGRGGRGAQRGSFRRPPDRQGIGRGRRGRSEGPSRAGRPGREGGPGRGAGPIGPNRLGPNRGPRGRGPQSFGRGPFSSLKERQEHLTKAVAILQSLLADHPANPEYNFLLALCHRDQSSRFNSSEKQRAIDILRKLSSQHPGVADYAHALAVALESIDVRRLPPGRTRAVEQQLRDALHVIQPVTTTHSSTAVYATTQARIQHKLAHLLIRKSHSDSNDSGLSEAESLYRDAIALTKPWADRQPGNLYYQSWLAKTQHSYAQLLLMTKKTASAEEVLDQIIERLEKSLDTDRDNPAVHHLLGEAKQTYALVKRDMGDADGEQELREQSRTHFDHFERSHR